jgi:hypothetical protein
MFVVTETEAAAIRAIYQQRGEFAAAVELRRRFAGITDNSAPEGEGSCGASQGGVAGGVKIGLDLDELLHIFYAVLA